MQTYQWRWQVLLWHRHLAFLPSFVPVNHIHANDNSSTTTVSGDNLDPVGLQTQIFRFHTELKELASNTKDRGFFESTLRMDHQYLWAVPCREHGNTALADLCIALDETSVLLKRLTDQTKVQESKMHSLSPPDDTGSLAFVLAVFKHNLAPPKTRSLVKSLQDMRSDVPKCLRKLETASQHSCMEPVHRHDKRAHAGRNKWNHLLDVHHTHRSYQIS